MLFFLPGLKLDLVSLQTDYMAGSYLAGHFAFKWSKGLFYDRKQFGSTGQVKFT